MTIEALFQDTSIKAKAKAKEICQWLVNEQLLLEELLQFAEDQPAVNQATCIEGIECATRKNPDIADEALLEHMTNALASKEPRVKWESAKVIGNIAKKFPDDLALPIDRLLMNSDYDGAVVRWATAYALGEILKLRSASFDSLLPKIERLSAIEKDSGVKNKYFDALKKVKK